MTEHGSLAVLGRNGVGKSTLLLTIMGATNVARGTVRWRESIAWMAEAGVTRFVEVGSGKVLSGLVKRIAPSAATATVGTPADVAGFLSSLQA